MIDHLKIHILLKVEPLPDQRRGVIAYNDKEIKYVPTEWNE